MAIVALLLSLSLVNAFNPLTDQLTYDYARNSINATINNAFFGQYILSDVKAQAQDLCADQNRDELQNLVNLWNAYRNGSIAVPHSNTETLAFIRANAPLTYNRLESLLNNFLDKFASLSKQAKAFYNQLETSSYKCQQANISAQVICSVRLVITQNQKWTALGPSIKAEFAARWPEIVNFVQSPYYQNAIKILAQADQNGNVNQIVQSMMQYWQMGIQEGNSGTSPAPIQV